MMLFKKRKAIKEPPLGFEAFADSYVTKAKPAIWRNVEGRGVILNSKDSTYYSVEGITLRIWELIDKGIIVSELVRIISDEYEENIEVVRTDLAEICWLMRKEGIVELRD